MKPFHEQAAKYGATEKSYQQWVKESQLSDPNCKWKPRPRATRRYIVKNGKLVEDARR